MKKLLRSLIYLFVLMLPTTLLAQTQTLIAGWDFQTTTGTPAGTAAVASPNSPTSYVANVGAGAFYLDGTNNSSSWAPSTDLNAFAGTTVNLATGMGSGATVSALAILGGTSNANNGKFIVFKVNMSGYKNLNVTYATQRTSTGFNSHKWEYSIDGSTWTPITTLVISATSFAVTTVPTVTGLDNATTAYLRLTPTGATAATGNNRFDNIQFNATAMPATQASAITFTSTTQTGTTANWTSGSGVGGRAVFMSAGSTGAPAPADLTAYNANAAFGSGDQIGSSGWYCVYNGTGSSVAITNLTSATAYRVAVVEYNGSAATTVYSDGTGSNNPANITTSSGAANSTDATLSALTFSAGTLSTTFSPSTLSYTSSVGYAASTTTVTPTVNQANATVQVKVNSGSYSTVSSGSASSSLALNVGSNTITVLVTAQDGTTTKTYTITVTRGSPATDATLSGLTSTAGTLNPATFASATTAYSASVVNATASVTVTPVANDATATIQVRVNGGSYATVASNTASSALSLNVGANPIDVLVTAQDGSTTKTYTITVTRPVAAPTLVAAAGINDTNFSVDWSPVSGATSYNYDVSTDSGFGTLIVSNASTTATNAAITGLTAGTTYYFRVTATGSSTTSAYSSTVIVATLAATNFTANYDFNSVTTTSGTTDPTPVPVVPNITFGSVTANGVSTNSGSANVFNFTNWGQTTSLDATKYYGVTITPASGYGIALSSITFSVQRSGTGAANYSVRSSADNFATDLPASVNPANGSITVASNVFTNANTSSLQVGSTITPSGTITGATTFQIYGYGSTGTGGTFRLDDVKFTGTLTSTAPAISTSGTLSALTTTYGSPSSSGTFNVSGANMTAGITVTPPTGFEVSTDNSTFGSTVTVGSAGTITSTPVYIRLAATTAVGSTYSGNVVLSSTGASSVNFATVTSSVTTAALTITANNVNKVYGNTLTGGAGSSAFTTSGLKNSETVGTVTITYGTGAAASDAAATYTGSVVPSAATGGTFTAANYTITYAAGNITVLPLPSVSYVTPQTYTQGTAITSLTPTSANVASPGFGTSAVGSAFAQPAGVARDASGNIYVADAGGSSVYKMSATGTGLTTIGSGIVGLGAIALDASGNMYVTEVNTGKLKKVTPAGAVSDITTFPMPTGIALDASGNIYVADQSTNQVSKIASGGSSATVIASGFSTPYGLAVDASGNIYVANQGNGKLQKIAASGFAVSDIATISPGITGLAFDAAGNLYYTNIANHSVNVIAAGTTTSTSLSTSFTTPGGLVADATGNVYVADATAGGSVKKVSRTGGYYVTPSLPAGLSIDGTTGTISGTPSATSSATDYTVTAFNANGSTSTTVNIKVNAPAPAISTSGTLSALSTTYGTASSNGTFSVSGTNMSAGITVTPPSGFEVSKDNTTFSSTVTVGAAGTIASTTVYIRLAKTTSVGNSYSGNVVLSSTGASSVNVATATSTVSAAALTITATDVTKTYGSAITGGSGSTAFTPTGLQNSETITSVTIAYGTGAAATDAANTYTGQVTPSAATGGSFNASNYTITYTSGKITVNPAALTVTANSIHKTYGSALLGGSGNTAFTSSGLQNTDAIASVAVSYSSGATSGSAAGTYTAAITPSFATGTSFNASNYTITYAKGDLIVDPAALTITANTANKTYGSALTTGSATTGFTPTGLKNADAITSVTLTYGTGAAATSAVGTYTGQVTPSAVVGITTSNYTITYTAGDVVVGAAALTITANDASKTYGQTLTGGTSTAFTSSGLKNSDAITGITIAYGTGASATSAVGTYTGQVTPSAVTGITTGNYSITYTAGKITVGTATLTITANDVNKVPGSTLSNYSGSTAFTSSGLQNSESAGTVSITYGTGAAAGDAAGTYPNQVTPSALTGGSITASNYTINYVSGAIVVGSSAIFTSGTISASSTTFGTASSTKSFTVAGSNLSNNMIITPPTGFEVSTSSSSGFGSTVTLTPSGGVVTGTTIYTRLAATTAVGSYSGNVVVSSTGAASQNVAVASSSVSAYPLTITANAVNKTYGSALTSSSGSTAYSITSGSLQNGNTISSVTITYGTGGAATAAAATYSGTVVPSVAVGSNGFAAGNYNITYTGGNIVVGAATLTITANDASKTYGQALTGGTSTAFTSSGLQNSDAITGVTIAYGTGATAASAVGTYTGQVTPSAATGITASNYSITYTAGKITVGTAALTITANDASKTYGQTLTGGTSTAFTSSGLQNSDAITGVTIAYGTGATATSAVGTYTGQVTPSAATGITASNYSITYATGKITVGTAALTITANDASKTYGSALTGGTSTAFTSSGLQNSDAISGVTIAYGTGSAATAAVGTYTGQVTPSAATGITASNYSITYTAGKITVGTAALTITANSVSKLFGATLTGGAGSTAFTSSGLKNADAISSVTIAYGTGAAASDAVGTYTGQVTPSAAQGITASNYAITYATGNITVTATSSPNLTASTTSLDFGTTQTVNTTSSALAFTLSGTNLTAGATLTTAAPYNISTDGTTFGTTASFTAAQLATAQTVYVKFAPTTTTVAAGSISIASTGATSQTVNLTGTGAAASGSSAHILISQIFGGGGNASAVYNYDYVELYNPTNADVDMTGWTVQYQSSTGTGAFSGQTAIPSGAIIKAHGYYLIQEQPNSQTVTVGAALPNTADLVTTGTVNNFNASGTSGKIALVSSTTALTGAPPTTQTAIVDFVAYGTVNYTSAFVLQSPASTTGAAPSPTNNTASLLRLSSAASTAASMAPGAAEATAGNGYGTNVNSADFVLELGATNNVPRNSAFATLIAPSSASLDFGSTTYVGSSALKTFTIAGDNLTAGATVTTSGDFTVSTDGGLTYGTSQTITAAQLATNTTTTSGVTVIVKFAPSGTSASTNTVTIAATGVMSQAVAVKGTGITQTLSVNPTSIAFGNQTINTSSTQSFALTGANLTAGATVNSTGSTTYTVSKTNGSGYASSISFSTTEIAANPTVYVQFTPTALGSASGNIAVTSTGATTQNVTLTGTGVSVPVPTIASSGTLTALSSTYGSASSSISFNVSGSNMAAAITVTPPSGFEVSTDNTTFKPSVTVGAAGTIASTPVYIRLSAADAAASYSGNVVLSSTSATSANVATASSTVSPAAITIAAKGISKTYGQALTSGVASNTLYSINGTLKNSETITTVTLTYGSGGAATDAVGTYIGTEVPSGAAGGNGFVASNYNITYTANNIIVTPAALTIAATAVSKTYGTALTTTAGSTAFTPTGLQNSETVGSVTITYGTGAAANAAVNTYTGSAVPSAATSGTFTASNYTITYTNSDITVGKAALTITANNAPKTYGTALTGAAGSTAFTPTGLQNSETIGSVTVAYGTGAAATAAVGTYTGSVTPSAATGGTFAAGNYTITYATGNIVVSAATLTITANNATKTYGGTLTGAAGSTAFTATGLANSETIGSVTLAYGTGAAATAAVGTYTGTVTPSAATGGTFTAGNYTITYTAGNIVVGQASLTIAATNATKVYGTTLTSGAGSTAFTPTGLVNSETVGSVTATYGAASAAATAAGTYTGQVVPSAATGGTFTASNYNISYTPANIIVTNAALTVTATSATKVYGTANPTLAVTYTGFVGTDNAATFTTAPTVTTTATATSGVGAYPITASGGVIPNYTITYVAGSLTVTKAALTVTADNKTKVYGTANPTFTATYAGFVGTDSQSSLTTLPTFATTAVAGSLPGTYPITISGATSANYTITMVNGTLTVISSSNADLAFLTITNGTLSPGFATAIKTYTDTVANSVDRVSLTPTLSDLSANMQLNGVALGSANSSPFILLNLGNNVITISITAQDGITKNTYTVNVYRASPAAAITGTNILSPNGDGKNDFWVIKDILLYPNNTVTVYDRGGRNIYSKHGYTNDWAGTLRGAPLAEGTYYYTIDLGNGSQIIKGFITILRTR